eukprot:TRINITY_DN2503_c0_g1_i1.p5 TRINITY_DN2503_c0_g1~~TRINITY_DN2503_c0_g1_i1.p5  ORF type:complete len:116 (-),score=29.80 TRINITY_DN2503_c0_g1_i1:86-433(-)
MAFQSDVVFSEMAQRINATVVKDVEAIFQFNLTKDGKTKSWVVDAKNGNGSVKEGTSNDAGCTITISDADYIDLVTGKLNGMQAFMSGKMKVGGNIMLAQKLEKLQQQHGPQSKL